MKNILTPLILILASLTACARVSQPEHAEKVTISESQGVPEIQMTTPVVANPVPAISDTGLKIAAIVEQAENAGTEADVAAVEKAIALLEGSGLLGQLESALEKSIAERVSTGIKTTTGLQLALSAVYGRKGMAGKAYAAILAAEKAATEPGVSFNLAVIHGRKALLAPSSKNGSFSLMVHCDIPEAVVTIDGIEQGTPPLRFEAMREGRHEVRIHAAGYEPYLQAVDGAGGETIELKASLDAIPASISVVVFPAGAILSVDGAIVGESSWAGRLAPGTHSVSASLAGYESVTKTIVAEPDCTIETISFNLEPQFTFIKVTANIPNTEVYFDGVFKGSAPLRFSVQVGSQIRIRLAPIDWWYGAQHRTVTLSEKEERTEHFEIVRSTATANFIADMNVPRGARVFIDGVLRGTVPFSIPDFPLGVYDLRIEASGYEPYRLEWGFTGTQLAITPMKKK